MPVIFYAAHMAAGQASAFFAAATVAVFLLLAGAIVGAIHGGFLAWLILRRHEPAASSREPEVP